MKLFSVAIGRQYQMEANRLARCLNREIEIFTEDSPLYETRSNDGLVNGLFHKANFANYITEYTDGEPVVFLDADVVTYDDDPFANFQVPTDVDIAYVPYDGKWWLPDTIRQEAHDYHGHKINSGVLYFKNIDVAKTLCNQWSYEYLEREKLYDVAKGTSKYEYDEWALMIALSKLPNIKTHQLEKKWNDWELGSEEEMLQSDSIFFQTHLNLMSLPFSR